MQTKSSPWRNIFPSLNFWQLLFEYAPSLKCNADFYRAFTVLKYLKILKNNGPVPTKDMQTPLSSVLIRFSWKMRNVLNKWKINFSIFIFRVIIKIHRKLGWFFVQKFIIFHEILTTFEKKIFWYMHINACKTMKKLLRNMLLTQTCSD